MPFEHDDGSTDDLDTVNEKFTTGMVELISHFVKSDEAFTVDKTEFTCLCHSAVVEPHQLSLTTDRLITKESLGKRVLREERKNFKECSLFCRV